MDAKIEAHRQALAAAQAAAARRLVLHQRYLDHEVEELITEWAQDVRDAAEASVSARRSDARRRTESFRTNAKNRGSGTESDGP